MPYDPISTMSTMLCGLSDLIDLIYDKIFRP